MQEAVAWAEEHLFDRAWVIPEHEIWKEALGQAPGEDFTIEVVREWTKARGYVHEPDQPDLLTQPEVLAREETTLAKASTVRGSLSPQVPKPYTLDRRLEDDHLTATGELLQSQDCVVVFRDGSGIGKSFVLCQSVDQLQRSGKVPVVLAPRRQRVVEMEEAGGPPTLPRSRRSQSTGGPEELRAGMLVGLPLIRAIEVRAMETSANAQEPIASEIPAL